MAFNKISGYTDSSTLKERQLQESQKRDTIEKILNSLREKLGNFIFEQAYKVTDISAYSDFAVKFSSLDATSIKEALSELNLLPIKKHCTDFSVGEDSGRGDGISVLPYLVYSEPDNIQSTTGLYLKTYIELHGSRVALVFELNNTESRSEIFDTPLTDNKAEAIYYMGNHSTTFKTII